MVYNYNIHRPLLAFLWSLGQLCVEGRVVLVGTEHYVSITAAVCRLRNLCQQIRWHLNTHKLRAWREVVLQFMIINIHSKLSFLYADTGIPSYSESFISLTLPLVVRLPIWEVKDKTSNSFNWWSKNSRFQLDIWKKPVNVMDEKLSLNELDRTVSCSSHSLQLLESLCPLAMVWARDSLVLSTGSDRLQLPWRMQLRYVDTALKTVKSDINTKTSYMWDLWWSGLVISLPIRLQE